MAFARENVDKFAVDSINQTICVVDSAASEKAILAILHRLQLFHGLYKSLASIQLFDAFHEGFDVACVVAGCGFTDFEGYAALVDDVLQFQFCQKCIAFVRTKMYIEWHEQDCKFIRSYRARC